MIIENNRKVKTNLANSIEFSVSEDSAKIFSFLSNFLYKDKERSVITELCSNALDAHRMVSKELVPIKVNLPTELCREFRVRDYGPGLTENQVYEFLTKYGSSSKTKSNEFIGGFGIGSKSPAAVTDTWTINSHVAGTETSYLIHVNSSGIPSINKLYQKNSETTGLEVVIPTKTVQPWHDAAVRAFEFYEVQPELNNGVPTFKSKVLHAIPDINLVLFKEKDYYVNAHILMNRRSYKLDMSKLDVDKMFSVSYYLPFDTSLLSVSLSREDLQYDSKTIELIKQRFADIRSQLLVLWKKDISPQKNIFDYQVAANEFKKKYALNTNAIISLATESKDVFLSNTDFNRLNDFIVPIPRGLEDTTSVQAHNGIKCLKVKCGTGIWRYNNIKYGRGKQIGQSDFISFTCTDKNKLFFVLRDVKNTPARVKQMLSSTAPDGSIAIILDKVLWDIIPKGFNKILGSSMELPHVHRNSKEKIESELFSIINTSLTRKKESDFDTTTEHVYIRVSRANSIKSIIDDKDAVFFKEFGGSIDVDFVFIKKDTVPPKWAISTNDWLQKKYKSIYKKKDEIILVKKLQQINNIYSNSFIGKMVKDSTLFKSLPANSIAGEILADIILTKESKPDLTIPGQYDILSKCAKLLNKNPEIYILDNIQEHYKERLVKAYPMLGYIITGYFDSKDVERVVDYIKLCGK